MDELFEQNNPQVDVTKRFYKEDGMWYIDLPEFLEAGLGKKANLLMVAGADTLLDKLSNNGTEITIRFGNHQFDGSGYIILNRTEIGFDKDYLEGVGHAPVDSGAYYKVKQNGPLNDHQLWLCPVTTYIFDGRYPSIIHIQPIQ